MINKSLLVKIKKDSEKFRSERNEIINAVRPILQFSKKSIFSVQQGKIIEAEKYLKEAEKIIDQLNKKYKQERRLISEGSYRASMEEYVEARFFLTAVQNQPIKPLPIEQLGGEEYLGGLADVTGELVRKAVLEAADGNFSNLKRYQALTQEIIDFMLDLYLSGSIRQKFDDAKRNLKRLEQIIYEVSLRK